MEVVGNQPAQPQIPIIECFVRLRAYINSYGALPPLEDMQVHIDAIESFQVSLYQGIREANQVAQCFIRDVPFRERFNLRSSDLELIQGNSVDDSDEDVADI